VVLESGRRINSYDVIGLLGQGGMGRVYRARDTRLGRDPALKFLPEEFARDTNPKNNSPNFRFGGGDSGGGGASSDF
jgi:serine/threonine protein kinase